MLAAVLALCLAPTPRPVERLTPELLPGRWECRWNTTAAWFQFHADGTYLYGSGDSPSYVGRWELRGGDLWLTERGVCGWHWTEYTVGSLDVTRYPSVTGTVAATTPFAFSLSNPRRFED